MVTMGKHIRLYEKSNFTMLNEKNRLISNSINKYKYYE